MNALASPNARLHPHHGIAATVLLVLAALAWARWSPGYSHGVHPLSLLGARGMPYAAGFNLLAYVIPGGLAAHFAWGLRERWGSRWASRIGGNVLMLSALAFAAQGLLPLDPGDLDGLASQRHAAAWMVWWSGFAAGAALLAWGERARGARGLVLACTSAAALVVLLAAVLPAWLGPPLSQRLGLAVWLGWLIGVGRISRSAA